MSLYSSSKHKTRSNSKSSLGKPPSHSVELFQAASATIRLAAFVASCDLALVISLSMGEQANEQVEDKEYELY